MPTVTIDNQEIFYAQGGRVSAESPTLLFIHGAGGRHIDWHAKQRNISNATTIAVDLPGHAASHPPAHKSVDGYVDFLAKFIEEKQLTNVIAVGHSMGGAIVLGMALRQLAQLKGLVIIGSGAKMPVSDMILNGLLNDFRSTVAMITKFSWSKQAQMVQVMLARRLMLQTEPTILHGDFYACSQFDVRDKLAEIDLPTLIIAGEYDKMMPVKFSQRMAATLPNAQLETVFAGHFMQQEKPDDVARLISNFVDSL